MHAKIRYVVSMAVAAILAIVLVLSIVSLVVLCAQGLGIWGLVPGLFGLSFVAVLYLLVPDERRIYRQYRQRRS
jgi:hypothetical protein